MCLNCLPGRVNAYDWVTLLFAWFSANFSRDLDSFEEIPSLSIWASFQRSVSKSGSPKVTGIVIHTYSHTAIQTYYHTVILPYSHTAIQTYYHTVLYKYSHTAIQSYINTVIMPHSHTGLQQYFLTAILSNSHAVTLACSHTASYQYIHPVMQYIFPKGWSVTE